MWVRNNSVAVGCVQDMRTGQVRPVLHDMSMCTCTLTAPSMKLLVCVQVGQIAFAPCGAITLPTQKEYSSWWMPATMSGKQIAPCCGPGRGREMHPCTGKGEIEYTNMADEASIHACSPF